MYRQIVKQYRLETDAWIRFGTFYFLHRKCEPARALLNEALSAIEENKRKSSPVIRNTYMCHVQ